MRGTYLDKPMPFRATSRRNRRRGPGPSRASAVVVVLALVVVNYFLFFSVGPDGTPPPIEDRLRGVAPTLVAPDDEAPPGSVVEMPLLPTPSRSPELRPAPDETDDFGEPVSRKLAGKLGRGQTFLGALRSEGLDSHTALPIIRAMEQVFDFRYAQVGNTFEAWLDDEGQVLRLSYVQSPLDVYEVSLQEDGAYGARKKAIPTEVDVARIACTIKSSLYESMARCGAGPQLGSLFIDLFAWDVDFFQDVRKGDVFRVIVERISVDGRFLKYGRVLAADYQGKFGEHRIVHYTDPDGHDGYYTPDGRAVRKDFLKSPLKYTRVSATGHSGIRANVNKASPVVYTASAGTPVWAVSAGTVVFAGLSGSLGTTVTIRHDNGYTSTYGHLGKLGRHIKVGQLVNQKTVLGFVGQSGKAAEPQLLFSLRRKGKLVRPLEMRYTEADPVPSEHQEHFDRAIQAVLDDLESTPLVGLDEKRS